ncbi:MAG: GAF domain-containing protein [Chloroflexi bacterium]|nr:GAF domain-containing protein [Chloroflexota bacterium]
MEQTLRSLTAQNQLLMAVNRAVEQDELLDGVLRAMLTFMQMPAGIIEIVDMDTGKTVTRRAYGGTPSDLAGWEEISVRPGYTSAGRKECVFVEDIAFADLPQGPLLTRLGFHSLAVVPLPAKGSMLARAMLLAKQPRKFSAEERALLQAMGYQAGIAIHRTQIYQRERQERDLAETLHRTSELVSSSIELDEVLHLILEQLSSVVLYDRAYITMITDGESQVVASSGFDEASQSATFFQSEGKEASEKVMEAGQPVIVHDVLEGLPADTIALAEKGAQVRSWLGAPLWHQGEIRGVILLESYRAHNFHPADAQVLTTFAGQASIAIVNAQLFELVARGKQAWEETFDAIEDGISVHDQNCRMLRVNRSLAAMLESTPQELVGQNCYRWQQCHGREGAYCPHDNLMKTGEAQSLEVEEGNRHFHLAVYPLRGAQGELVGSVHSIKDVTKQRQLQTQLVQAEKLSAIGELVAGVAHELNNPLTTILGYAQLLMQEDVDATIRDDLSRIARETLRSRRIVENLLTFARKHEPEKSAIDINKLIEHTLEMRAYQLRVDNIEVALQLYRPLPRTMADQYQLQQLFINLINNAHQAMIEAHGHGKLLIRTSLKEDGQAIRYPTGREAKVNRAIRIEIEDNGPGIGKDVMAKMFDPFFTTKKLGQGTGLGLSICYGIIQEHDGRIWAESSPEHGATFVIELPVQAGFAPQGGKAEAQANQAAHGQHKILVVDDEEGVVALLKRLLSREGHDVEGTTSGESALELISSQEFDLIISDVKMPGFSGQKLYQKVRQQFPEMARHTIFLSGDTVSLETRTFLEATESRFLRKPFSIAELKQVVNEVLKED